MPAIHFRTTVDADPDRVHEALATQDGLAGNWTDQLEVPEQTGEPGRAVERREPQPVDRDGREPDQSHAQRLMVEDRDAQQHQREQDECDRDPEDFESRWGFGHQGRERRHDATRDRATRP